MAIWQIGCGSGRCYDGVFFNDHVALIGPGDPGEWNPQRSDTEYESNTYVRRFASEVKKGDIFVLKKGKSRILAIGIVVGDYQYLEKYEDVKGWDLQHARRVQWIPVEHNLEKKVFSGRLSNVNDEEVKIFVKKYERDLQNLQYQPLPELYSESVPLNINELTSEFPSLCGVIERVQYLYNTYTDPMIQMCPLEKESQTHLVIPFLTALGWKPEQIAIERQNVDITLFDSIYRSDDTCRFMIEVKTLGAGVEEDAFEQVQGYSCSLNKKCNIVVTDGIRYRLYTASSNFCQNYYANLSRLKKDCIELFRRLQNKQ